MALHHLIISLAMILVITVVIHYTFIYIYKRLQPRLFKTPYAWDETLLVSLYAPFLCGLWLLSLTFVGALLIRVFPGGMLSASMDSLLGNARELILILGLFWFGLRYIKAVENYLIDVRFDASLKRSRTTTRAMCQLSRILIVVVTLLTALQFMGYPINGLLAFGGVGTIAMGFAAKDSLSNFFGGMMIFWDKPFSVGDWVRSPDRNIEGTVETIGWRLTRIRTFDKRPIYVPNSLFSTIIVENPSRMTNRRIKTSIGLRYADAPKLDIIVDAIKKMLQDHPDIDQCQTLMVNFFEFGASSLNIFIYTFTKTTDWERFHVVQQDVFLKMIQIIDDNGAQCAFPTTTIEVPEHIMVKENTEG